MSGWGCCYLFRLSPSIGRLRVTTAHWKVLNNSLSQWAVLLWLTSSSVRIPPTKSKLSRRCEKACRSIAGRSFVIGKPCLTCRAPLLTCLGTQSHATWPHEAGTRQDSCLLPTCRAGTSTVLFLSSSTICTKPSRPEHIFSPPTLPTLLTSPLDRALRCHTLIADTTDKSHSHRISLTLSNTNWRLTTCCDDAIMSVPGSESYLTPHAPTDDLHVP